MRYNYFEIIRKYNEEVVNLINQGYVLLPHTYSNGVLHDNFIKGTECKVLELDRTSRPYSFVLKVSTSTITRSLKHFEDFNSWDFKKKDCVTETINTFYSIKNEYCDVLFEDSTEEIQKIREVQRKRILKYDDNSADEGTIIFDSLKANNIAYRYMKKQPRCKSVKPKDIRKVEKRWYKDNRTGKIRVDYIVFAKGQTFLLR